MDTPTTSKPITDFQVYLAEERTFLAWIRTGVALMGFGLVVAHFELFAEEPHINAPLSRPPTGPHSGSEQRLSRSAQP